MSSSASKWKDLAAQAEEQPRSAVPAMLVTGVVVGGMMALTLPFIVMPAVGKNLPYMATPAVKMQRALNFLQQHNYAKADTTSSTTTARATGKQRQRRTFLDLGSGDGDAVYQAVKLVDNKSTGTPYYQSCTGVELNSTLYLLSSVRRAFFWTREERARSTFVCRDFWHLPDHMLREADTVLIFGIQPLMRPFSETLALHIRPGTHVLSYRFHLPVVQSSMVENCDIGASLPNTTAGKNVDPLLQATLIYDEDEMRIYECTASH